MDIQKRLDFITENSSCLTEKDSKLLARIYLTVKAEVNAKDEEQEAVKDLKYSNSRLISKKVELNNLKDLLFAYFQSKGIKNSLLSLDDIIALINADIRTLDENMFDNEESEKVIKDLSSK